MNANRFLGFHLLVLFFLAILPPRSDAQKPVESNPALDCGECHTCAVPTSRQPCLKSCPRDQMVHQVSKHRLEEAPDSIVLSTLVDLYEPVHFNHKRHAGMAEMSQDCATCHHFSPPGRIPPCQDCHAAGAKSEDLTKPNLKGAYHRQCLSCHREWSHSTTCIVCHKPNENGELGSGAYDPTDIVGKTHPVITTPVKLVYNSSYKTAPIVTFQHKEHIELFGFRCVDCHEEESCGNCHDIMKTASSKRSREEMHSVCGRCHDEQDCKKCHDTKERPGFSHNRTGWPLGSYHNQLSCWSCHPAGRKIGRLSRMCVNCHGEWNQDNFRHAVVGLVLDEVHSTLDCSSCHIAYHYDKDPVCSDCHDDNRTANTAPPGVRKHPR